MNLSLGPRIDTIFTTLIASESILAAEVYTQMTGVGRPQTSRLSLIDTLRKIRIRLLQFRKVLLALISDMVPENICLQSRKTEGSSVEAVLHYHEPMLAAILNSSV